MNSRERVLAALNHRQPDRVPLDFGGHRSSGIMAIAYSNLKKALGIDSGDIYVYDMVQQLAIVEPIVLDRLGVDTIDLGRAFLRDRQAWKDWVLPDGTTCKIPTYINAVERGGDWYLMSDDGLDLAVQKRGSLYFDQLTWPLADRDFETDIFADLREAFGHCMWTAVPTPGWHIPLTDDGLRWLGEGARALRDSTDRAIIGAFGGNMFEVPQFLFGMENYLTNMGMYPDACLRLSEALCEVYEADLEKWLRAVGPYIDVVQFGDDLGTQNGPLMSRAMYRSYFKPFHARLWKRAKELADVKVLLHSCGGIEPLLGELIDAGLDSVNPVQVSARDMGARHLKDEFGGGLTFWGGGCDTQEVLPRCTPEQVRRHVREQISILNPGGGFIFNQVHNIQADVPAENVLAMFDAVRGGEDEG